MNILLHQIASGFAAGGIYGALALAFVMIYRSTHHINFAQGEMAMFSTFIALSLIEAGFPYWLSAIATIAVSFVGGAAIERLIIRRFADSPHLTVVIVFLALFVMFNSIAGWIWNYTSRSFPSIFPDGLLPSSTYVSGHELGMILVVAILVCLLYAFFQFTSLGLAMRAAAQNRLSSRFVGIRVDRMIALGWGISASIGALAGIMVAPIVFLDPNMMSGILIYAFAAALLGGIDSPFGAVLGGFIVGVLENLLGAYVIGTELKLTAAFAIIIAVLLLKPSGLFGRAATVRV
jgi:branched-chain amino acid transport system permease protein